MKSLSNSSVVQVPDLECPASIANGMPPVHHVTQVNSMGEWGVAPQRAYAVLTVRSPLWGSGDNYDEVVGYQDSERIAVDVRAGKSLTDCVAVSSYHGDSIVGAIAITREDFVAFNEYYRSPAQPPELPGDCGEF